MLHVLNSILLTGIARFCYFPAHFALRICFILLAVRSAPILLGKFGLSWPILRHCAPALRPEKVANDRNGSAAPVLFFFLFLFFFFFF